MADTRLFLSHVDKTYLAGEEPVYALRDVSLELGSGELVALVGPSGCGKSTLLNLAGCIDRPTRGEIRVAGRPVQDLDDRGLTLLRREKLGYVFQFFHLLPTLDVFENVALPLQLLGWPRSEVHARVDELLERLGLSGRRHHRPHELSGGQMQRVALARAIAHRPALLLADEPTGNLDTRTGQEVLDLLGRFAHEEGHAILMATHSAEAAAIADRVVGMRDGAIVA